MTMKFFIEKREFPLVSNEIFSWKNRNFVIKTKGKLQVKKLVIQDTFESKKDKGLDISISGETKEPDFFRKIELFSDI